ncbi:MAG: integrase arm-type DNA-binding domain-containing protein [Candidatus Omnitrophica bacterium]|nr:integrase arm-type DNA-binding domain-containing protein [Candidatus Omnitrophota bacterium]
MTKRNIKARADQIFDRMKRFEGSVFGFPVGSQKYLYLLSGIDGRQKILTPGKYGAMTVQQAGKMAKGKLVEVMQGKDPAAKKKPRRLYKD